MWLHLSSSAVCRFPFFYDNTKIAVARILGDGKRKRTRVFSELVSHYLFKDRFGRPGKGNDKGKVEGMVRRETVTHVLGTNCYLCLRVGPPDLFGCGG